MRHIRHKFAVLRALAIKHELVQKDTAHIGFDIYGMSVICKGTNTSCGSRANAGKCGEFSLCLGKDATVF